MPKQRSRKSLKTLKKMTLQPKLGYTIEDVRQKLEKKGFKPGTLCVPNFKTFLTPNGERFHNLGYSAEDGVALYNSLDNKLQIVKFDSPFVLIKFDIASPEFNNGLPILPSQNFFAQFLLSSKYFWTAAFNRTSSGIDTFTSLIAPYTEKDAKKLFKER